MLLIQRNKTTEKDFVSNASTVTHEIDIKQTDRDYIKNATSVFTYWFVDCTYYGITTDMKFLFNYTSAGDEHTVEALVMADFTPLPPTTTVPPTTTTTKPSTTTSKPTTPTSKTTTTTAKPNSTTTVTTVKPTVPTGNPINITTAVTTSVRPSVVAKSLRRRSTDTNVDLNAPKIMTVVNGLKVPYNVSFPYVCNGTQVATDSKKSYGYFFRKVQVKGEFRYSINFVPDLSYLKFFIIFFWYVIRNVFVLTDKISSVSMFANYESFFLLTIKLTVLGNYIFTVHL